MKDIIIVNFKAYKESTTKHATALARICRECEEESGKKIYAAVQAIDITEAHAAGSRVLAQHVDAFDPGARTGFLLAHSVKAAGASGTLLNHSEHRLHIDDLKKSVDAARKEGLTIIVCADTPQWAEEVAKLSPDYIAIEPPELIGGNIWVSTARPEIITQTIERVHKIAKIPILCGAGVKTGEDVRIAKSLGAAGILVASGVVLAKDPKVALLDLANGLK